MTRNQLHGKTFEDWIKACGRFPGSADAGRSPTAAFDIEARFDRELGLPTSIKATGNKTVALSDARNFWAINQPIRMIVGSYRQNGERKSFTAIHEFILNVGVLHALRGGVTAEIVANLHEGILTETFPVGDHVQARVWIKEQKALLKGQFGSVVLNPKIDSKTQRRMQCSVSLNALIGQCVEGKTYWCHTQRMGEIPLPVELFSTRREFG